MPQCEVCSEEILSQTLVRVGDLSLHEDCLQCCSCHCRLETSCYSKHGSLYCRTDYLRLFGPRCERCGETFQQGQEVRRLRDRQYHLHCFQCSLCATTLHTGMKFGAGEDGALYCENHFNVIKEEAEESETSFCSETGSQEEESKTTFPESPEKSDKENEEEDQEEDDKKECKDGKRRGPRTTIKAKQLEMLRTIFNQNPKPTRAMREQLAKDTGLPMRVIQVWFQNKRSKEKRMHQLRFSMAGGFRGGMAGMFPPNTVAFTYPPYYSGEQQYFQDMPGIYPSPPHIQGEFSEFTNLQTDCFPSPPISDCSSPDYHLELQC